MGGATPTGPAAGPRGGANCMGPTYGIKKKSADVVVTSAALPSTAAPAGRPQSAIAISSVGLTISSVGNAAGGSSGGASASVPGQGFSSALRATSETVASRGSSDRDRKARRADASRSRSNSSDRSQSGRRDKKR